jgi:hypothetical protein
MKLNIVQTDEYQGKKTYRNIGQVEYPVPGKKYGVLEIGEGKSTLKLLLFEQKPEEASGVRQ